MMTAGSIPGFGHLANRLYKRNTLIFTATERCTKQILLLQSVAIADY